MAYPAFLIVAPLFLLFLTFALHAQGSLLAPVYSNRINIIKAIVEIFKSNPIKTIGYINLYGYQENKTRFQNFELFNELSHRLCDQTCYIHLQSHVKFHFYEHSNLVLVDTFTSLRKLYGTILETGTRNVAYTLIHISSLNDPYHPKLQNIFQRFYDGSVLNIGIVVEQPNMDVIMVSYDPFRLHACHLASPYIANTYKWKEQRWLSKNYFPDKLNNFRQCKITTATWEDHPYYWNSYDAAGKLSSYEGIEGKLIEFLADTLNFSLDFYILNENEKVEVFNLTGYVFNEIFQSSHFSFGGYYCRPDIDNSLPFSQSDWYFISAIYFVVTVFKEINNYGKLTLPFSDLVWYLTIMTALIGVLVIFVAKFAKLSQQNFILGPNNRATYYKMFSLAMGGNYDFVQVPRRNFARFLLMVWLLATLVLRSAYQSGMYQLLTKDQPKKPPNNLQDIIAQDYTIRTSVDNDDLIEYLQIVDKKKVQYYNNLPLTELENMASMTKERRKKIALMLAQEYYGYFRKMNPISKEVHVSLFLVQQRLYSQQLVFYIRNNSYLIEVFNKQIEKAHNYGFSQKWRRMYVDDRVTGELKEEEGDAHKPLSITQLQNMFEVLLWFLLVSAIIFVIELIYENCLSRVQCKIILRFIPK